MITSLISGKLIADPRSGQSANGNGWCRVTVACPVQGGKEGEPDSIVATVIAFGDEARKLEKLTKGDSISAVGSSRLSHWERNGETRTGLDIVATQVMTPYLIKQKRNHDKDDTQSDRPPKDVQDRYLGRHENKANDFNDNLGF